MTRRVAPEVMAMAGVGAAAFVAAVVAFTTDDLVGDAAVITSLVLALVAVGLAAAALVEWASERRSFRRGRRKDQRRDEAASGDCRGCGAPFEELSGIRVCPSCDAILSTE